LVAQLDDSRPKRAINATFLIMKRLPFRSIVLYEKDAKTDRAEGTRCKFQTTRDID
jgi:hypothetical protein